MKKIQKSKKGFTLVEMVLVIVIICILAAVALIGVSGYIQRSQNASASLKSHNEEIESVVAVIDGEQQGG